MLKNIILSLLLAISCQAFYAAILPERTWRLHWIRYTKIPAFMVGFTILSTVGIPAYIWQPVRLIVIIALIAQFYFQTAIRKNLILSVTFCVIFWLTATCYLSVVSLFSNRMGKDALYFA